MPGYTAPFSSFGFCLLLAIAAPAVELLRRAIGTRGDVGLIALRVCFALATFHVLLLCGAGLELISGALRGEVLDLPNHPLALIIDWMTHVVCAAALVAWQLVLAGGPLAVTLRCLPLFGGSLALGGSIAAWPAIALGLITVLAPDDQSLGRIVTVGMLLIVTPLTVSRLRHWVIERVGGLASGRDDDNQDGPVVLPVSRRSLREPRTRDSRAAILRPLH